MQGGVREVTLQSHLLLLAVLTCKCEILKLLTPFQWSLHPLEHKRSPGVIICLPRLSDTTGALWSPPSSPGRTTLQEYGRPERRGVPGQVHTKTRLGRGG